MEKPSIERLDESIDCVESPYKNEATQPEDRPNMDRRLFLKGSLVAGFGIAMGSLAAGCSSPQEEPAGDDQAPPTDSAPPANAPVEEGPAPLPAPEPDPSSDFGVDLNINMETIDNFLGREDVAYRDVRMLFDPADFGSIGGNADLSATIRGFKIVPYPYLASLPQLPVSGAYDADKAFTITWKEDGSIDAATPNFEESQTIVDDLFPKDKAIFLMCGGGGYAGMTKALLVALGWSPDKIYNVGGNWSYQGKNAQELIVYSESADGNDIYATWRADYALIDFSRLHPIA
jgi:rhodanese-related sulfurtransferase